MDHIHPAEDSLSAQPDERQLAAEAPASQIVAALYERYRDDVYAYCQRRLRNPEEAEDATQVTFLKAFTGLKNGAVPQVENAWLFTIAKRVVFTRLEATDRLRAVEAKTDVDGVAEERGGPVERAAMDDVWKAVEALPEAPRRAFLMREWQGLEYDEIAQELGVERNHVGVILFRARSRVIASLSGNKVLRSLGNVGSLSAVVRRIAGFFAGEASQLTVAVTVAASPVAVLATHDHATGTPTPARSVVAATYPGRVASGSNAILRAPVTGESRMPFIVQRRPTTPVPRLGGESTSPGMPAASPGGPVGNTDEGGSVARDPTPATDPVEAAGLPAVGGGVDPSTGPGDGAAEEQKRTTSGLESGVAGGSADAASRNPHVSGGKVFVDPSSPKRSVDPARGRGEGSKGKGWIELGARGDGHGNGRGNGNGSSGAGSSEHSGGQAPANRGSPQGPATLEPTQPPVLLGVDEGSVKGDGNGAANGHGHGNGASAPASPAHGGGQAAGDEGGSSLSDALGLPAAEVAALAPAAAPETPLVTAPPVAAAPVAVPPPVATPVATPPAADVSGTPAKKPKK
jgi:RNA polymerase sigma-70 factor (ECF subfamily)